MALAVALLPFGIAQYADFSIPSTYTSWDNANWVLNTDQLIQAQYQSRAPMANGYDSSPYVRKSQLLTPHTGT